MKSRLVKIGKSRGVRLPKAVIDRLGLEKGVELQLRSCFKTVGDCPDFAQSAEQNGTVPFSETVLKHLLSSDEVVIRSIKRKPREGWAESCRAMAKAGDDEPLWPAQSLTTFDEEEWEW